MDPDRQADIAALDATLTTVERVVDVDELREKIRQLEQQASDPKLWDDQTHAQKVTSDLSHAQNELRRVEELRSRVDDLPVLYELAAEEGGADELAEADAELNKLREDIEAMEVRTLLGEYDEREALVNIRSGAGGVDAADWAEMLMRMYIRWAEQHDYPVEVFDTSYAEEAGIKSATFAVHAPYAYGNLSVEQGTHRLVRISPFDNQSRRQTSFADVEVLPVVETTDSIDIPEGDVRVDVYRSSGPGGQSVNTTDSAVRLTHIPTGIVVTCQNEKSQLQNKVSAMRVLQAKLLERKRLEERAEMDALKGDGGSSWGNQMRSYVLHPYQMVKDLRTEYEVGNPAAVLDGDIDGFLEAGIRWRNQKTTVNSTLLAFDFASRWHGFWRGDIGVWILDRGVRIALLVIGALLAARFINWTAQRITRRIDAEYQESEQLVRSESAKHRQAVASVISWVAVALLFVMVAVQITDILAIPIGSLVAPAAVIGAALGFGAQRVVQDLLSGFFIITEKQYGFGDLVALTVSGITAPAEGTVEDVTLRVTKLRSAEGEMFTIPNGQIVKTVNLSKDWARAVIDIPVPASVDLNAVNDVLHEVAKKAIDDPQLEDLLLDAPQLMGVESIELDTVNLRMVARTLPGKQFEVGRRMRILVIRALRLAGIVAPGEMAPPVVAAIPHPASTPDAEKEKSRTESDK